MWGGLLQNRRGDGCPSSWPLGRPWERERMSALMVEECGTWDICGKIGIVEILEIRKFFGLWKKERKIREKEKGKEFDKWRYFLDLQKWKYRKHRFLGLSLRCGKHYGKYRNRPKSKYLGTTRNFHQKSIIT